MTEPDRTIWTRILAHLRQNRPELWRQWFEEIELVELAGGLFTLRVEAPVRRRYLKVHCAAAIAEAAQSVTGRLVAVRFEDEVAPAEGEAPEAAEPVESEAEGDEGVAAPAAAAASSRGVESAPWAAEELVLIPDNTFENFVVGPNNRLAHAAALAIAGSPGRAYNPMFIHGGVGLGKTHLLHAVCQKILATRSSTRILYISCEDFVSRFMDAVQAGQMAGFRHYFRNVEVLVIDDIHFLAKRDRTQEEFFHTFNTLYQNGRQIILSSDAAPDEIPHLEDRLVSRFKWGLVARVDAPEYETRVAIVLQKARNRGVAIPQEVANLIAARYEANIRELEGALTRVQMQAMIEAKPSADGSSPITVELARKALGLDEERGPASDRTVLDGIVDLVTGHYGVTLAALQSKRRQRSIALPRQVCMYLGRRHTRYSLEEIGAYFGGRDHTTVLHAVRLITSQRQSDPEIERTLQMLEGRLAQSRLAAARV